MRLYHLTPDAERVLTLGFTDGEEQPGEDGAVHRGVWFSDRPLEARAGVLGDTLLAIELPEQVASRHELRLPAASAFREFCIPAEQLRSVPIVMLAERVLPSPLRELLGRLPPGAGAIGMLSSEEWTPETAAFDRMLLAASRGPRVGIVLAADPEMAEQRGEQAVEHFRALGADPFVLPVIDRAQAADPRLPDIDLVSIGGGDPRTLRAMLAETAAWRTLVDRWRDGMTLSGSSAGAMILCTRMLVAEEGATEPTIWSDGLGPLDGFALAVHATERGTAWLAQVAANAPVPVVAIDDATGIVCTSGTDPRILGPGDAWHVHQATLAAEPEQQAG